MEQKRKMNFGEMKSGADGRQGAAAADDVAATEANFSHGVEV